MQRQKMIPHAISGVFVFLLLGVFAVLAVVTVLLGAYSYRYISARADMDNNGRMATAYIRSMLRARDEAGMLELEQADSGDTLLLHSRYGDEEFVTRIYVHDGVLRELFTAAEDVFDPGVGEAVCPAEELRSTMEKGLLTVRVRIGDEWQEIACVLHGETEEATA